MRIVDIRETAVPLKSDLRNSSFDFSEMTTSIVAVITDVKRGGRPVANDDVLTVAINSYRAAGGGGYSVWKKCPRVSEADRSLRDLLVEDARKRKTLDPHANENWFLAPSLPEGRLTESN